MTPDVDSIQIVFNEASLTTLKIVIGAILFGIALDTRWSDFQHAFRQPKAMAIAILAQFLILPALTFVLTLALNVRGSVALGMILVASCPPGNVSNILTHRAKGDVALSVSMTAIGNVIAIVMMPLNVAFWGSLHPTGEAYLRDIELSAVDMFGEIALVIGLPFVLGIAIAYKFPRVAERSTGIVGKIAVIALGAIIVLGVAGNWEVFVTYIGVVLIAVFLHDALALLIGYTIARVGRLDLPGQKAMTFEVGIRNAGLGLLIVFSFFDGLGGMALVAAWWGIWDIIAGLTVAMLWARRSKAPELV